MMKDDFEKALKEALREYVKDTEVKTEEEIKFSKKHKQKMAKLFSDVENFKYQESNNYRINENTSKLNVRKIVKVAAFIILALLITIAITPSMIAWRTDKLGLYGNESGEYSWVLPNDITEVLENNADNICDEDLAFLGYLPEGSEVVEKIFVKNKLYIKLKVKDEVVSIKVLKDTNRAIDMDEVEYESLILNDDKILFVCKDSINTFIWEKDNKSYNLYGTLDKLEMIKIIENINYEEISKKL